MDDLDGFDELEKILEEYSKKVDNPIEIMEVAAKDLVEDVRRLPRPRSASRRRTHLLDTITFKSKNNEIEVGWGLYYGPMVERGTKKMRGTPHIKPVFEMNKIKYFKKIQEQIFN